MKKAIHLFSLILACIILPPAVARAPWGDTCFAKSPLDRQIRYSFTLRNTTDRTLSHVDFWTYAPVKENTYQKCKRVETSHPCQIIVDGMGNQALHFSIDGMPPYATRILAIRADVSFQEGPIPAVEEDLRPYVAADKYIEVNAPEIQRTATVLRQATPRETVERIFQWVSEYIRHYEYASEDRGALYALLTRKGDCSEAMYLFVALCRASGIPARGIGGYVCAASTVLDPNAYHNWGEFYEGGTWHMADPQRRVFREGGSRYVAMRIIGQAPDNFMGDRNRFRCSVQGVEIRMNRPSER